MFASVESTILTVVLGGFYFVLSWSGGRRATIGQRLFKIQVGNAFDGAPLTFEQAIRRWLGLGEFLGLFVFAPGLAALAGTLQIIWSLVLLVTTATSPTKQGLHDRFANTALVRPTTAGNGGSDRPASSSFFILFVFALIGLVAFFSSGDDGGDPVQGRGLDLTGRMHETDDRDPGTSLDHAQTAGLADMDPATFRAAAHQVVDLMADYLDTIEERAVFPSIEPGSLRPRFPADATRIARAARRDPRRLRPPHRAERHPLAAPRVPGLLRDDGVRPGDPRRDAHRGPRPEPDAVADVADRDRARGGRGRLAAPGPGSARRRSTACSTDTASTSSLIALAGARQAAGLDIAERRPGRSGGRAGAAGLRLGGSAFLDREGVHDPGPRARVARSRPDERTVRAAHGGPRGGDRRGPRRRAPADRRSSPRSGTTSSTSVDPVAAIADIAEREGPVAARRRRLRRRRRDAAGRSGRRSRAGSARIRSS